jgi:hypothetical protein
MTHVTKDAQGGTTRAVGVSRTQSAQVLGTDAGLGAVNSGGQPKRTQTEAQPHPSADPFNDDRGSHDPDSGKKVLDEAVISGSHLPRKK